MDIKKEIRDLRELLKKYSESYYNENESLISDYEYDKLLEKLNELEKANPEYMDLFSPTMSVGARVRENRLYRKNKKKNF